ncbi:TPA: hypothetical protein DCE37_15275 [Candidatus Latescibacteria bacterium]|nr:hypothetical protein [Candidatus Latescibacterota bacterium]
MRRSQGANATLDDLGCDIRQATRWTEAIAEVQENRPEMVLLDLYLPTIQREAILEFIRDLDKSLPVVIVSSEIDPSKLEQLGRKGQTGSSGSPSRRRISSSSCRKSCPRWWRSGSRTPSRKRPLLALSQPLRNQLRYFLDPE